MPAIDRRLLTHFEWLLPLLVLAVAATGILTIYSATYTPETVGPPALAMRQLAWLGAGVVGMLLATAFDYRRLDHRAYLVYGLCCAAVFAVPLFGSVVGGSRRWLRLGPIAVQPSEFMKLGLVIVLAHFFARSDRTHYDLRQALPALVLTAVPAAFILVQPDLGSASLVAIVSLSMMVIGGVRLRWFVLMALPFLAVAPVLWNYLKEYQQQRILMFLDPTQDPLGAGYHIIQSTIAVGSGMLWGKGWLQGTQAHLEFIPERHTDFIFAVYSEEFGLIGNLVLLVLYALLIARGLVIATHAATLFGRLLAGSISLQFFVYAFVNMGMVSGILPVVGVPLPFLSYGGTALLTLFIGVGILMSIQRHRKLVQT